MRFVLSIFIAMSIAACSGTSAPASSTTANGGGCSSDTSCSGGICVESQDFPGGYCTTACKLSDPSTCPSGSVCIDDVSGVPVDAGASAICYESCQTDTDCKRSGYRCLEKANHMVCRNGA